jgi:hypothetical protein
MRIQTKQGLERSQSKEGNSSCYKTKCCEKNCAYTTNDIESAISKTNLKFVKYARSSCYNVVVQVRIICINRSNVVS